MTSAARWSSAAAPGARAARSCASTRWSSSAATPTPSASCSRWSTASRTSPPTPASRTCASCTATSTGAASAMRLAVAAGGPAPENNAYVQRAAGRARAPARPRARGAARVPSARWPLVPGLPGREAGLARLERAARRAIARLAALVDAAAAARVRDRARRGRARRGRSAAARRDLALVGPRSSCSAPPASTSDVELAVFEADHGDPRRAVTLARRGWAQAPSVRAADALGWALTRAATPRPATLGAARAAARLARPALARARRASRRSPPGRRDGGAPAAADRARARARRLALAGAARSCARWQ